jgi:hypothetical protein
MENGRRSDSRAQSFELAKTKENRQKVVPNQALYQAEPQPELIVNPPRQRGARPLFRLFCHAWQEAIAGDTLQNRSCHFAVERNHVNA